MHSPKNPIWSWPDTENSGNPLELLSGARATIDPKNGEAISLDGISAYAATKDAVFSTTESYSVAAWVRLESSKLRSGLSMDKDEYAWTAVSQDSPTHSPFYLGVRKIPVSDDPNEENFLIHWNVTMAPLDGSVTGTLEWRHATSDEIKTDMLDKWFLLVAVCDVPSRQIRLHIPGLSSAVSQAPEEWPYWQADGGLQIGRARWLGNPVDHWPGSVGAILCFADALDETDAKALAAEKE